MAYTSANEYLQALDQILKKNRGTRVNTLYDTASNVPDQLQTADPIPVKKKEDYTLEPDAIDQMQFDVPQVKSFTPPQKQESAPQGMSTSDFLQQLGQAYFTPEVQEYIKETQTQPQSNVLTDIDGGYLGVDNKFYYNDGTVRESSDASAYAIGSMPGGGYLYSDDSIRRPLKDNEMFSVPKKDEYGMASVANGQYRTNLGNIREGNMKSSRPISSYDEFLKILSAGRFSSADITGDFNDQYTNSYGMPYQHQAVDVGTGGLDTQADLFLPFDAEVIGVDQYKGNPRNQPYGNSVIAKLPTGHILRFNHLSQFGQIKVGDKVNAGTYLGTTGSTGNVTGPHLDQEVYSPEGGRIDPVEFINSIKSQPEIAKQLSVGTNFQLGDIIKSAEQPSQSSLNQPQDTGTERSLYGANSPVNDVIKPIENVFGQIASGTSDYIEKTKPTGDYGVGGTELLRGDISGAGKELGRTIEKINPTGAFDLGGSELLAGRPQLAQEKLKKTTQTLGENVAWLGKSLGLPEGGASEFITQIPSMFAKPAYAAEMGKVQEAPQSNVFANTLAQAGQGVSNLKDQLGSFMDENIFKKKDLASMGQKNVIGEDTGGAIASNIGDIKSTPADNRNAFFKAGGLDTYKDQLSPGVTSGYRGALNTNLFKDTFYQNPDNVANVFGNTSLGKDATGKYKSYMGTQYPIKPGGESPTIKKTEQYLGSYDGLLVDGEYWKDAFSRQGKDVNSGEGKGFQDQERRNQQTYTWEDVNPIYYENQYNKSVLDSIPEVLQSAFSFIAPKTGKTAVAGGMSSPQGLYQPVKNDTTGDDKYKDARSIPQMPSSNVFKPQGQIQSIPQVLGASINKPTIPKPVPTPQMSRPQAPAPNSSYNGQSVYNPPPAPSRPQAPAPNSSYNGQSVYNPPPAPSRPSASNYSAPKPAPRPANNQSNVFQNLINYLLRR